MLVRNVDLSRGWLVSCVSPHVGETESIIEKNNIEAAPRAAPPRPPRVRPASRRGPRLRGGDTSTLMYTEV